MSKTMKMQWINFQRLFKIVKRYNSTNSFQASSAYRTFVYGNEVKVAKKNGQPIVALESTIITHGMPYPDNLKTAIKVENAVRAKVTVV